MLPSINIPSLILTPLLSSIIPYLRVSALLVPNPGPAHVVSIIQYQPNFGNFGYFGNFAPRHVSPEPAPPLTTTSTSASTSASASATTTSSCDCAPPLSSTSKPSSTSSHPSSPSSESSTSDSSPSSSTEDKYASTSSKPVNSSSITSTSSASETGSGSGSGITSASGISSGWMKESKSAAPATSAEAENQTAIKTKTSSASEPEKTEDDSDSESKDGENGHPTGKFGSLTFRLGQHTMLINETAAMDNRAQEPKTVDFTMNNDLPQAYAGNWTFVAFGTNDDGGWGMNVEGSQVKSSIKCSVRLDVGSESDEAVVELTDTSPYSHEIDPSNKLWMNCDSDSEGQSPDGHDE
ncbi:hypothetical protein IAT40_000641 [Kwoniella sp. CBS 6097]